LTVTGKAAAVAVAAPAGLADAELLAGAVLPAGVGLLAEDPQAARAVAPTAAAATTAAQRRGILIWCYFLPEGGKEGETVGAPLRPGRITLPTRADVVKRAVVDLAERPPAAGASQLRDSAGIASAWEAAPASLPGALSACGVMTPQSGAL
jgi:hypothetical protein